MPQLGFDVRLDSAESALKGLDLFSGLIPNLNYWKFAGF